MWQAAPAVIGGGQLDLQHRRDVQAWRWLNTLEADGIVRLLKKYPRGTRLAREYRYEGD